MARRSDAASEELHLREVLDVNEKSKVIFVKRVPGISLVEWDVDFEGLRREMTL